MGYVVGDSVGAHGDLDRDRPDDQEDQRLAADALDEFFGDQCCEWSHGSADPLPKPQAGQHHYGRPVGQEKGGIAPELLLSAPFERDPAGDLFAVPGGEQRRLPVEDFGPAGDGEREAGEQIRMAPCPGRARQVQSLPSTAPYICYTGMSGP